MDKITETLTGLLLSVTRHDTIGNKEAQKGAIEYVVGSRYYVIFSYIDNAPEYVVVTLGLLDNDDEISYNVKDGFDYDEFIIKLSEVLYNE